jgi:hypothetical protein
LVDRSAVITSIDGGKHRSVRTRDAEERDRGSTGRELPNNGDPIGDGDPAIRIYIRRCTTRRNAVIEDACREIGSVVDRHDLVTVQIARQLCVRDRAGQKADGDADETAPEPHKSLLFPPLADKPDHYAAT